LFERFYDISDSGTFYRQQRTPPERISSRSLRRFITLEL